MTPTHRPIPIVLDPDLRDRVRNEFGQPLVVVIRAALELALREQASKDAIRSEILRQATARLARQLKSKLQ